MYLHYDTLILKGKRRLFYANPGFLLDRQNTAHIWKHKIDDSEAEEVFINEPVYRRAKNGSYIAFGVTAEGRYLFIVFRKKGKDLIRVITARDMTKREKQYYKKKGK